MATEATRILLTGAGFTHNFGTPLANEVSDLIFNHSAVQSRPNLTRFMSQSFDYESAYNQVMDGDEFSPDEKKAMHIAVSAAYEEIDAIISEWKFRRDATYPVNIYGVQELISRFAKAAERGFFFTLNQDLFVERHFCVVGTPFVIPGIPNHADWFSGGLSERPLAGHDYRAVPAEGDAYLSDFRAGRGVFYASPRSFYIKLHGSFNWVDSKGNKRMIIGGRKIEQIRREPLLSCYFEMFREVLCAGGRRLLVIGYGFSDPHINSVIADAINKHELAMCVVSPQPRQEFAKHLEAEAPEIADLKGGYKYFCNSLLDLFPGDQSGPRARGRLYEHYFDEK